MAHRWSTWSAFSDPRIGLWDARAFGAVRFRGSLDSEAIGCFRIVWRQSALHDQPRRLCLSNYRALLSERSPRCTSSASCDRSPRRDWLSGSLHARTGSGRVAAKQRGVRFGRPPKLTSDQIALTRSLVAEGTPAREAAKMLGVHAATLYPAFPEWQTAPFWVRLP